MCPTMGKLAAFWKEGIELKDFLSWGREGNVLNSDGNISFLKKLLLSRCIGHFLLFSYGYYFHFLLNFIISFYLNGRGN
jgi:hypothetical protein